MAKKVKRGPKRASKRGVVKTSSKGKGAKKYLAENWASILLLVVIIVLLIVGIVYSQKSCRKNRMENMTNHTSSNPTFAMFHAPWCGHCKTALPKFKQLKGKLQNSAGKKVEATHINADENAELAKEHGVAGYPTMKYYPRGLAGKQAVDYKGGRTVPEMSAFVAKQ